MATQSHRGRTADRAQQEKLEELLNLQDTVLREQKQLLRDGQPSGVRDLEEHSQDAEERGLGLSILEIMSRTVQGIETALQRLESGELGTCSECRGKISAARLRAVPFASLCLACQEQQDAGAPMARH